MSKAVIATGGKQYIVTEGETLNVELLGTDDKQVTFEPLLVIDGDKVTVGAPAVSGIKVTADILDEVRNDKVTSIRYKAKKRVHKLHGHRQRMTAIKIAKIA
jgi:large subunit ribosomal protein L21